MRQIFVDSGVFFAELVPEDKMHENAVELFDRAKQERWSLVTTNIVVIETHALILNCSRRGREIAIKFLDAIENSLCKVERISKADEQQAIELIRYHQDKTYSFCDALSFVVMERLGVREVISFDSDFRSYGQFVILQN